MKLTGLSNYTNFEDLLGFLIPQKPTLASLFHYLKNYSP